MVTKTKPYSSRLLATGDWLLVRKPQAATRLDLSAVKDPQRDQSRAIIVDIGPGEYRNGCFAKPDERFKVGMTILADAQEFSQFKDIPEMKEEGLFFLPSTSAILIELD